MTEVLTSLTDFNLLPPAAAQDLLRPACASDAWLIGVVGARPYPSTEQLITVSDAAVAALDWPNVEQALAAHPRIGERAGGADRESSWSREEQAGAVTAADDVVAALHRGNVEYERRFGHVFLMCATGRTPQQMLAQLYERMDNDADVEQDVVRRELAAIVRLRLARLLH